MYPAVRAALASSHLQVMGALSNGYDPPLLQDNGLKRTDLL